MIDATGFLSLRSSNTFTPFRRPSAIFIPLVAISPSKACSSWDCPFSPIFLKGKILFVVDENTTTKRRPVELKFRTTKAIACFRSASFHPAMLPLTSRTTTRSIGAREDLEMCASSLAIVPLVWVGGAFKYQYWSSHEIHLPKQLIPQYRLL